MHTSVKETAVHLRRKRKSFTSIMNKVAYDATGIIPSQPSGGTNMMISILHLPQEERSFQSWRSDATGKRLLLCAKQGYVMWMMDIKAKFSKAADGVEGGCAGTFSVAGWLMPMPRHSKFVVYDLNSSYVAECILHPVITDAP